MDPPSWSMGTTHTLPSAASAIRSASQLTRSLAIVEDTAV